MSTCKPATTAKKGGRPASLGNKTQRYLQKKCGGYAHVARSLKPPINRQAVSAWGRRDHIPDDRLAEVRAIEKKLAKKCRG